MRSSTKRRLAVLGVAMAVGGGVAGVAATPASAASIVYGNVSIQNACRVQYGSTFYAVLNGTTVYDWACSNGSQLLGVDVSRECANEYGSGAYAVFSNRNDPYTWYCVG